MTEYFLDAFLNILLCMAYLNDGKDGKVNEFIQKYYDKISNFVIDRDAKVHSEYIIRKLTSNVIRCDVEWVRQKQSVIDKERDRRQKEIEKKRAEAEKKRVEANKKRNKNVKKITKTKLKEIITNDDDTKKFVLTNDGDILSDEEIEKQKIVKQQEEERLAREEFMKVKQRILERERLQKEEKEKRIKALVDELNGMVGLSEVKEEIQSLINLIKIRKLREEMNMPVMDMSYHMVFTGSPGTGKTLSLIHIS